MGAQEDADGDQHPAYRQPFETPLGKGEQQKQPSNRHENEPGDSEDRDAKEFLRRLSLTDWIMAVSTFSIAVATIWNIVYVHAQLSEMKSNARQMNALISANQKLASANRSIIFVQARMDSPKPRSGGGGIPAQGIKFYQADAYFSLLNKGTLPASIYEITTDLYMGNSWTDSSLALGGAEASSLMGRSVQPSVCGAQIITDGPQANLEIDSHSSLGECKRTFFFQRKAAEEFPPDTDAHIYPRVFWFHLIVKYSDVTGIAGETCYLSKIRGPMVQPVTSKCNYQK